MTYITHPDNQIRGERNKIQYNLNEERLCGSEFQSQKFRSGDFSGITENRVSRELRVCSTAYPPGSFFLGSEKFNNRLQFVPRFNFPNYRKPLQEQNANIVCHYCRLPGHFARFCPYTQQLLDYKYNFVLKSSILVKNRLKILLNFLKMLYSLIIIY